MKKQVVQLGIKSVFVYGTLFGLLLSGCAAFGYRYYGLNGVSYSEGKLLGPSEEFDRPFSDCAPNAQNKNPCVVMFATEFFALKKEYQQIKVDLEKCQKGG